MDIKSAMKLTENQNQDSPKVQNQPAPATGKSSPGQNDNMLIPNVLLISKHLNGSLNQWQISFSDNSKFSTVVSVAHASRACGHRFRTNNATCHPVLPLLLTTSHHNIPSNSSKSSPVDDPGGMSRSQQSDGSESSAGGLVGGVEFCSELILWRVDPVGPLSKSGGIVELARINSPELSAFASVAWVPTLLPRYCWYLHISVLSVSQIIWKILCFKIVSRPVELMRYPVVCQSVCKQFLLPHLLWGYLSQRLLYSPSLLALWCSCAPAIVIMTLSPGAQKGGVAIFPI